MNITVGSPSGSQGAVEWVVRFLFAWSCLVLVGVGCLVSFGCEGCCWWWIFT